MTMRMLVNRMKTVSVRWIDINSTTVYYTLIYVVYILSVLFFCLLPSRWSTQNLQRASHPVRTPESDHQCSSDGHFGVHCHRKSKAYCFLEQARYQ